MSKKEDCHGKLFPLKLLKTGILIRPTLRQYNSWYISAKTELFEALLLKTVDVNFGATEIGQSLK